VAADYGDLASKSRLADPADSSLCFSFRLRSSPAVQIPIMALRSSDSLIPTKCQDPAESAQSLCAGIPQFAGEGSFRTSDGVLGNPSWRLLFNPAACQRIRPCERNLCCALFVFQLLLKSQSTQHRRRLLVRFQQTVMVTSWSIRCLRPFLARDRPSCIGKSCATGMHVSFPGSAGTTRVWNIRGTMKLLVASRHLAVSGQ
jgi:hypothetical protein